MSKGVQFKNYDRFIRLGIAIGMLRRVKGFSQEVLADKAGISRSLLSSIEAPGVAKVFSMEVFFDLADALEINPAELIRYSEFPDIWTQK